MDWQETLERAIPQPPPAGPDPAALVADGKRLVRRRRIAVVAGTVAAVIAVVGIGMVVDPARERATPTPPIASQSAGEETAEEEWPPPVDIPLSDLAPVAYDFGTGETTFQEGWTEVDRVGPLTSGNRLAVAATDGTTTIYAFFDTPYDIAFVDAARTSTEDLRAWVDGLMLNPLEPIWENGELEVGSGGWDVVREISNPLGYDAPWESAAAIVERDGAQRWLVHSGARVGMSEAEADIELYAIPGQTFEEWLSDYEKKSRPQLSPEHSPFSGTTTTTVEFGSGSELVPAEENVAILEQAAEPDIADPAFSERASRTAVARIQVGEQERYVLARERDGVTMAVAYSVVPAPRAEDRRPLTLAEFAAALNQSSSPGQGLWR